MSNLHEVPEHTNLFALTRFTQPVLIASLIVLSIYYANFCLKRWKWYYHSWNVPGPLSLPIIGCAYRFLGDPSQRMEICMDIAASQPEVYKVWMGPNWLLYHVIKPEYIEKLISHPSLLNKDNVYDLLTHMIGEGILTSKGAKWKSHRKIMARSFHQKILDDFVRTFDQQATILVDILKKSAGQKDLPLYILAIRCHLADVCATTMGVEINVQASNDELGKTIQGLTEIFGKKVFTLHYYSDFIWNRSADKKEMILGSNKINDLCATVVRKKIEAYKKRHRDENNDVIDDGATIERKVMLDLLIENADFTEKELKDEVSVTLMAATETSANTTVYILVVLALYPDIQQKIYEEVMEVVGPEKNVEPKDITKLEYTERVIKETLRLFPVIGMVGRRVAEDVAIGEYVAPAGASIVFPIIYIHRNERYWKDPMKFDPDRFLPANVAERHPLTYMPFSAGIRNCIGWRYGMMNLITLTARIVRDLKIFTEYKCLEEVEMEMNVFTRIKHGPKVWFETRR